MYDDVLDTTESLKLQRFLDGTEPGVLYLYGTGGNGKSTLMNQIRTERPHLFEKSEDYYQVVIHHDSDDSTLPTELTTRLFKNIVMTNVLPDGVDDDHIVYFRKTFGRHA